MNPELVAAIASLALAAKQNAESVDAVIVPDGYKLQALEQFDNVPKHYRARFETSVLPEFVAYCTQYTEKSQTTSSQTTNVFINLDNMKACAIFDMGTPENPQWGKHRATLALNKTPAYSRLLDDQHKMLSQQNFLDFAEDWQTEISFFDENGEPIDSKKAKNALRKLKSEHTAVFEQQTEQYSASRSALESIEIKSGDIKPPAFFKFSCQPYEDFPCLNFTCQLRITNNDKKDLLFKYRIMQLDSAKQNIADLMRVKLKSGLEQVNASVFIGDMSYQI